MCALATRQTRKATKEKTNIMTVVAFLQCLWAKDPVRVAAMLDDQERRYPDQGRERMLARLLFYGGRTGQVLTEAFGSTWCGRIVWEESTRQITGKSSGVFPADPEHMRAVLQKHKPTVVLTFGRVAEQGYHAVQPESRWSHVIALPHPVARGVDVMPVFTAALSRLTVWDRENK